MSCVVLIGLLRVALDQVACGVGGDGTSSSSSSLHCEYLQNHSHFRIRCGNIDTLCTVGCRSRQALRQMRVVDCFGVQARAEHPGMDTTSCRQFAPPALGSCSYCCRCWSRSLSHPFFLAECAPRGLVLIFIIGLFMDFATLSGACRVVGHGCTSSFFCRACFPSSSLSLVGLALYFGAFWCSVFVAAGIVWCVVVIVVVFVTCQCTELSLSVVVFLSLPGQYCLVHMR